MVALSFWSPIAYLWQDVLVALLFFAVFFGLRRRLQRPWIAWAAYAVLVAYIAINVPITLVLSTPLTWTILRATGGPLADSIVHSATVRNLAALALPAAVGLALPLLLARRAIHVPRWVLIAASAIVISGPLAVSRVDTRGWHRNALGALAATSVSRLAPRPGTGDWRASPFGARAGEDLTHLRGSMRGRNVMLVILESTRRPPPRALRRHARSRAEPDSARAAIDSLRAGLRGVPGEHQGSLRDAVLAIPGVRHAARAVRRSSLRLAPCHAGVRRVPHGPVPLGAIRLSRHAVGDRPSRVRGSRGCGSHRRTRGLELRGGRGIGRRADARLDRLIAQGGALLRHLHAHRRPSPVRVEHGWPVHGRRRLRAAT